MFVPLDSSRPLRFPSELAELVQAVLRTDSNNESTWIEWKSSLDLREKTALWHVAKHVLGFANRAVTTAQLHADGHGYLVVGAEPGSLVGITPVDPANLRPQVQRYVGPAVRWLAEYVSVAGKQVLVVIVDPPQHGDPIHPVRTQLDAHPKGRVLVRRQGSTDRHPVPSPSGTCAYQGTRGHQAPRGPGLLGGHGWIYAVMPRAPEPSNKEASRPRSDP